MVIQRKDKKKKRNFEKLTLNPVKFEDAVKDFLKTKPEPKKESAAK